MKLGIYIVAEEWNYFFSLPLLITEDPTLRAFQYRLLHRILGTNTLLMKCKYSETELCTFCTETKETYIHLFFECSYVRTFWLNFFQKLEDVCNVSFLPTLSSIILGVKHHLFKDILNTCILILKRYVYLCRVRFTVPSVAEAIEWLKYYYRVDMVSMNLCSTSKAIRLKEKWSSIDIMIVNCCSFRGLPKTLFSFVSV